MLNYKQIWHGIKPIRWLNKFNLTYLILFYHPKKQLYQLYHTILQYTQHPKTLLFYHFIKILFFNLSLLFLFNVISFSNSTVPSFSNSTIPTVNFQQPASFFFFPNYFNNLGVFFFSISFQLFQQLPIFF